MFSAFCFIRCTNIRSQTRCTFNLASVRTILSSVARKPLPVADGKSWFYTHSEYGYRPYNAVHSFTMYLKLKICESKRISTSISPFPIWDDFSSWNFSRYSYLCLRWRETVMWKRKSKSLHEICTASRTVQMKNVY